MICPTCFSLFITENGVLNGFVSLTTTSASSSLTVRFCFSTKSFCFHTGSGLMPMTCTLSDWNSGRSTTGGRRLIKCLLQRGGGTGLACYRVSKLARLFCAPPSPRSWVEKYGRGDVVFSRFEGIRLACVVRERQVWCGVPNESLMSHGEEDGRKE